ncbi:hypothetical protein KC343_g3359 [Hortaea werneckii]|nr:hypothetical protein KC343_g3359 [Hortaea werneckii]KAI7679583.1 hypothetical protein KC319_g2676 [Hortaea werneckii]KAI7724144.1 hypothetical protein KC322_g247 [Hortaea werneckii]
MADPSRPTTLPPTSAADNPARSGLNTATIVILAVVGALTAFGLAIALYCACGYGRLCSRRRRRGDRRRSSFATDGRELHHFWNREVPLAEGGMVQHEQQQKTKRRGSGFGGELGRMGAGTYGLPPAVEMARVKVRPARDVDALDFRGSGGPVVVVEQTDGSQQMPGFRERKEKSRYYAGAGVRSSWRQSVARSLGIGQAY